MIYRNLIVLFIFCCGFATTASGQVKVYAKVKMENGKTLHGEVVEYVPRDFITLVYKGDTITAPVQSNVRFTSKAGPRPYGFVVDRNYHNISVRGSAGAESSLGPGFGLDYSYIYQKTEFIGYGGGAGYRSIEGQRTSYTFVGPYGVFRSYLKKSNSTAFVEGTLGYFLGFANETASAQRGGLQAAFKVGLRLSEISKAEVFIGYEYQGGYFEFETPEEFVKQSLGLSRIMVGAGFSF